MLSDLAVIIILTYFTIYLCEDDDIRPVFKVSFVFCTALIWLCLFVHFLGGQ